VLDFDAARGQGIRDQRAMAAPGNGLGAHDRDLLLIRGVDQLRQARFELGRLHVVGETAKGRVMPPGI